MSHKILDSHIHLWPSSASNPSAHSWMQPNHILTKPHLLENYFPLIPSSVAGVIYVETDRALPPPSSQTTSPLEIWAAEPIKELEFLKEIIEGKCGDREAEILKGIVIWAPMNQGPKVLAEWLSLAEKTMGKESWSRVKGVRFLLQGITEKPEFETLVLGEGFKECLKLLGRRRMSFDVGVSCKDAGVWQLELFTEALGKVYQDVEEKERVVVVMNHMCKPDYTTQNPSSDPLFKSWQSCIKTLSTYPQVSMKLSGGFSELSPSPSTSASQIAQTLKSWTDTVFQVFGPERIMFGSDWPVCNVKGPEGEESWSAWGDVVQEVLREGGVSGDEESSVWSGCAGRVYRVDGY